MIKRKGRYKEIRAYIAPGSIAERRFNDIKGTMTGRSDSKIIKELIDFYWELEIKGEGIVEWMKELKRTCQSKKE